jgi:hypothetical protein
MSDNKKTYYIHQFMGKHPHKIKPIVKIYAALANALKIINWSMNMYLSKYSKYVEGLLINMFIFIFTMICHGRLYFFFLALIGV